MTRKIQSVFSGIAMCAIFGFIATAEAGTIIKLDLGGIGPDISMNGAGILSTTSDAVPATTGDQNTQVTFTGFLDIPHPDINTNTASFSLAGLATVGPASTFGSLVIQNFFGGNFSLYDPANVLLLSGNLSNSALTGVVGPPGTGALFTTSFSSVTGGTLAPELLGNSLTLSMNLSTVNGGAGFNVLQGGLVPFLADASINISADPIPEPVAITLLLLATASAACVYRRRS